jgi:hypothetical protein
MAALFVLKAKRPVIELPLITPIYEEYRQFGCICPNCRHEQVAVFPLGGVWADRLANVTLVTPPQY